MSHNDSILNNLNNLSLNAPTIATATNQVSSESNFAIKYSDKQ